MKNYAIELLEEALKNELIYHSQSQSFLDGTSHGAKSEFFNRTMDAFRISLEKADKRIPELIDAIEKLKLEK